MHQQELDCLERSGHAKPILRRAHDVIQFIGTDLFETSYHTRHDEYILPMIQEISKYFLNTSVLAEQERIDDDRVEHEYESFLLHMKKIYEVGKALILVDEVLRKYYESPSRQNDVDIFHEYVNSSMDFVNKVLDHRDEESIHDILWKQIRNHLPINE